MKSKAIATSVALGLLACGGFGVSSAGVDSTFARTLNSTIPPACALGQLQTYGSWKAVNLGVPGGGAVQGRVDITNTSKQTCSVAGFLKIQLVGSNALLAVTERHTTLVPVKTINLKAGKGRAHTSFQWLNWCKGSFLMPLKLKVSLPQQSTHRSLQNVDQSVSDTTKASCVNPTAGSAIDVNAFAKG
jgi:hypothetical protein